MIFFKFAPAFILFYIGLCLWVIQGRWKYRVALGQGEHPNFQKRFRIAGNFNDYIPFTLLFIYIIEKNLLASQWLVATNLSLLLIGRVLHLSGILKTRGTSIYRFTGMCLTYGVLLWCAFCFIKNSISIDSSFY